MATKCVRSIHELINFLIKIGISKYIQYLGIILYTSIHVITSFRDITNAIKSSC